MFSRLNDIAVLNYFRAPLRTLPTVFAFPPIVTTLKHWLVRGCGAGEAGLSAGRP